MSKEHADRLKDYVEVPERIAEFREKFPDGRLRPVDPDLPYRVENIGNQTFIVYVAAAYRSPDDQLPGIGIAWEPFPGQTPYTKNSELQNAETSAWGRAIIAALAGDAKRGIATAQEVAARQAEAEKLPEPKKGTRAGADEPADAPADPSTGGDDAGQTTGTPSGDADSAPPPADPNASVQQQVIDLIQRLGWNDGKALMFARRSAGLKSLNKTNAWGELSDEDATALRDALAKEIA